MTKELKDAAKRFHKTYRDYLQSAGVTNDTIIAYVETKREARKIPSSFDGHVVETHIVGIIRPAGIYQI